MCLPVLFCFEYLKLSWLLRPRGGPGSGIGDKASYVMQEVADHPYGRQGISCHQAGLLACNVSPEEVGRRNTACQRKTQVQLCVHSPLTVLGEEQLLGGRLMGQSRQGTWETCSSGHGWRLSG